MCEENRKMIFFFSNFHTFLEFDEPIAREKYSKMVGIIEYLSNFYYSIFVKIFIPISFLPYIIFTMTEYYAFDSGDESYLLPFPTSWVGGKIKSYMKKKLIFFLFRHHFKIDYLSFGERRFDLHSLGLRSFLHRWVCPVLHRFHYAFIVHSVGC